MNMNLQLVEGITDAEIEKITSDISEAVSERLRAFAAYKREAALLHEVRQYGQTDKEQVWEYLRRTEGKRSSTRHVSRFLSIKARRLGQIRGELVAEGKIKISRISGTIRMELVGQ